MIETAPGKPVRRAIAGSILTLALWGVSATAPRAAAGAGQASTTADRCVISVGDLTGDGISDYAISAAVPDGQPRSVSIVFGRSGPLPAGFDQAYIKQNLAATLRGPAATPFACPDASFALPARAAATAGDARTHDGDNAANGARTSRKQREPLIDQPVYYKMVDLDPLTPGHYSVASAINARGAVVGRFLNAEGFEHAFAYDGLELRDLGTLGGHFSDASGINSRGESVGYSLTGDFDDRGLVNVAFSTDDTGIHSLGLPWSTAAAINEIGQIVGSMSLPGSDVSHAFALDQGIVSDLGTLPTIDGSGSSSAHAINGVGQIVGQSAAFVPGILDPSVHHRAVRGFLHQNGAILDLGSAGVQCNISPFDGLERCREESAATDINEQGTIVGFSTTPAGLSQAAIATAAGWQLLGTLGGSQSWAFAVNDSQQIVGTSLSAVDGSYRPFVYDRGVMRDLNELILDPSGPLPFAAYDINNFGQIVGNHHLLTPVYPSVTTESGLSFPASIGKTLTFGYWVSRAEDGGCSGAPARVRIDVRVKKPGAGAGEWRRAGGVRGCGTSTNWHTASVRLPKRSRGTDGQLQFRIVETGVRTSPTVYLRDFRMK